MFAEERPHLLPLPIEPFRYYQHGERTVHLDGHVEVDGAYYAAPPGRIGARLPVQWDGERVRLLDRTTGRLLREHLLSTAAATARPRPTSPRRRRRRRCSCSPAPATRAARSARSAPRSIAATASSG